MIKASQLLMFAAVALLLLPGAAPAAKLDGSVPLLCSIIEVIECSPGGECLHNKADDVNLPFFVKVDVGDKVIRVPQSEDDTRSTPIRSVTHIDDKLILQGVEEGIAEEPDAVGWTMSIDEDDGRMIFSISREKAGFIVFGACTQP